MLSNKDIFSLHRQPCHGWWLYLWLPISMTVCSPFPIPCLGQATDGNLESQVKAAYIYNFTQFVYWDKRQGDTTISPIIISVLGNDPVGDLLKNFSEKQAAGRAITVKQSENATRALSDCHLIFIGGSEKQQLPAIFQQLRGTNVLTVSDIPGFARHGGMIGFFIEDGRVKIEIDLNAVNNAGLKVSAKLLEIARIVSSKD